MKKRMAKKVEAKKTETSNAVANTSKTKTKEKKDKEIVYNTEKGIEIKIDLKTSHMYEFQMRHIYLSTTGIISVLASIVAFIYFMLTKDKNDQMMNMILILIALMFTVIYPLQMLKRSVQLVKLSPVLSKTLNYTFTSEGILVSQDNDDALLPWENIIKVVETKKLLLVYSSPKNGYILPKVQYKEHYEDIKKMIKKQVNKEICKLQLREAND